MTVKILPDTLGVQDLKFPPQPQTPSEPDASESRALACERPHPDPALDDDALTLLGGAHGAITAGAAFIPGGPAVSPFTHTPKIPTLRRTGGGTLAGGLEALRQVSVLTETPDPGVEDVAKAAGYVATSGVMGHYCSIAALDVGVKAGVWAGVATSWTGPGAGVAGSVTGLVVGGITGATCMWAGSAARDFVFGLFSSDPT